MTSIEVTWPDAERSRAVFTVPQEEEWTVKSITELMRVLAQIREGMTPEVPLDPPLLQPVHAIDSPRWWTSLEQLSGGTLFLFRHPSLGWLSFLLPSHERNRISALLAEQEVFFQEKKKTSH